MSASASDAPGGEVSPLRPLPKSSEAWHLLVALAYKGIKVRCKGGRLLVHKSEHQRLSATETQALQRLRGELVAMTSKPDAFASWIALQPTLVEPPHTMSALPVGFGFKDGYGRPNWSFSYKPHAAVPAPRGTAAACS